MFLATRHTTIAKSTPINLLQLRNKVRLNLNNPSTSLIANSAIVLEVNNAQDDIAIKLAKMNEDFFEEQKTKFNLIANSGLHSVPTDCIKIKQIRLAYTTPATEDDYKVAQFYDPSAVKNVSVDESSATVSNPIVDLTNNYFRIFPKPTNPITNGGEMYYIARPSAMVLTGTTPVIPVELHPLMVDYATMQLAASLGMVDKYKIYKQEWEEGLQRMATDMAVRLTNDNSRMVSPLERRDGKQTRELY